jgi:hypothetical protein
MHGVLNGKVPNSARSDFYIGNGKRSEKVPFSNA